MSHTHLAACERYAIAQLTLYGLSDREIGRRLGRSHATIGPEQVRNGPQYPLSGAISPAMRTIAMMNAFRPMSTGSLRGAGGRNDQWADAPGSSPKCPYAHRTGDDPSVGLPGCRGRRRVLQAFAQAAQKASQTRALRDRARSHSGPREHYSWAARPGRKPAGIPATGRATPRLQGRRGPAPWSP